MENTWLSLCNSGIGKIQPYIPGKPESQLLRELKFSRPQIIKLNSNESAWGPTDNLKNAHIDAKSYPDGDGFELKQALANHHQVNNNQITLGNGSNDVLDILARVFLNPQTNAVYSQYAFIVYALSTQAQGATSKVIPALNYAHDISAMVSACDQHTRLLFIANPNNPTGTYISADKLYQALQQVPEQTIIVLDQAYQDYLDEDLNINFTDWLSEFENLVICRTFSKAYGLAAYRIGYSLSSKYIADLLNRVRHPFNTSTPAQQAALIALKDQQHITRIAKETLKAKQLLEQQLQQISHLGIEFIPSKGNFLCCHLGNCANTIQALAQKGIMVRPVANYQLSNFARITIGKPEHNERLIEALKEILSP